MAFRYCIILKKEEDLLQCYQNPDTLLEELLTLSLHNLDQKNGVSVQMELPGADREN